MTNPNDKSGAEATGRIDRRTAIGAMAAAAALALPGASSAAGAYTLGPVENGMQLKTPDGRVVWEYMTKKPENSAMTSPSAACFHPVNTPSGETITSIAPNDHPHHRGIFFGWHDSEFHENVNRPNPSPTAALKVTNVRRADFWAWGVYAPREGRVVQNRDIKLVSADDRHATIEIHNDLMIDNRKMGEENDTATVTERDGVF